jgi:hypothetical protein
MDEENTWVRHFIHGIQQMKDVLFINAFWLDKIMLKTTPYITEGRNPMVRTP